MASALEYAAIAKLTKRQRRCLRLVFQMRTTKEISAHLNVNPHTVDADIKRAVKILDASGRTEAARILASYETENPPSEDWYYQSPDLSLTENLDFSQAPVGTELETNDGGGQTTSTETSQRQDAEADSGDGHSDHAAAGPEPLSGHSFSASTGPIKTRRNDPTGSDRSSSDGLESRSSSPSEPDAPYQKPELWGRERKSFRNSIGGTHGLSALKKVGIILASAICLMIVVTAGLASLKTITELCATSSLCKWPRTQPTPLGLPKGRPGEQHNEERRDTNGGR